MQGRLPAILLLVALVAAFLCPAQDTPTLTPEAKRFQLMQREKMRILKARREAARTKASSLVLFQVTYANIAKGNEEQRGDNLRLAGQLKEHAEAADKKRLFERRDNFLRLAEIYRLYARQNERIVKAYKDLNSAEIHQALDEIAKIEERITALGAAPAKREWFTLKELEKIPLPGQKPPPPAAAPRS
jgi:hypothetical protein